jgi:hypothetical protein
MDNNDDYDDDDDDDDLKTKRCANQQKLVIKKHGKLLN